MVGDGLTRLEYNHTNGDRCYNVVTLSSQIRDVQLIYGTFTSIFGISTSRTQQGRVPASSRHCNSRAILP